EAAAQPDAARPRQADRHDRCSAAARREGHSHRRRSAGFTRRRAGADQRAAVSGGTIAAVAAVDERTAAEAVEQIVLALEPPPFVVDPIESLRPAGPNARLDGNVWMTPSVPAGAPT